MAKAEGQPRRELVEHPEELVYRSCYAPADLRDLLQSAEERSKIRRLPPSQLFFGIKELSEEEVGALLPHVTEEQWTGVLDLDLWSKDRVQLGPFLAWQRYMLEAEPPVARKLARAADPELWELAFRRGLRIYPRTGEDEFETEPQGDGEFLETPDGQFLIELPADAEKARLYRGLLLKLYELDPEQTSLLLTSCRFRTSLELEETAYQNRRRRIEDMGFQDYFEAVEIYTPRYPGESLPEKQWEGLKEMTVVPLKLPEQKEGPLLLFQAFALVESPQETQSLVEELFYVCNKVLSADRISPAHPRRIKATLRKAIFGMNLGLDLWTEGNLSRALEGVRRFYLQSFFQLGYGQLLDLQREARKVSSFHQPEPGSLQEAFLDGLLRRYPVLVERKKQGFRKRFFRDRRDLQSARRKLNRWCQS